MNRNIGKKISGLLLLAVSLMCTSCYRNTLFFSYQDLPNTGWISNDTLTFNLPKACAEGNYEVELGLRHTVLYPYRDLWIGIRVMTDSTTAQTDTLHLQLASAEGAWKGNSSGGLYQLVIPTCKSVRIADKDSLRSIRLFHLMKDRPLRGLSDIGLRLYQKD